MASPFHWRLAWVYLFCWHLGCVSQSPDGKSIDHRPLASQTIQGSWAVIVNQSGGLVTRNANSMSIALAVEDFEDADFERFGYWNQSGFYEHSYGGDGAGSFRYHFTASDAAVKALQVSARLSAEAQGIGASHETSEVSLVVNGIDLGTRLVKADDMRGEVYRWQVNDPQVLRLLNLKDGPDNQLQFLIKPQVKQKNGICIYGKALAENMGDEGQGILITLEIAEDNSKKQRLSQRGEEL
ncbi:MAG: hypothetical protein ACOH5I_09955 [Oligoflexus sp.]